MSKEEKSNSIFDFFSNFDKSTQLAYIISRFYYQILGIYFPAVVLVTFFYFYYADYLSSFYKPVTETLSSFNDWYLTVLVFIGIVVITGESINIVSSRFSFLSPGTVRVVDKLKKSFGMQVKPEWLYEVEWPIWFGIADYPIQFSSFDRYYLESLDKEKRSLAGKIGWTTFFRNMAVVFLIIFLVQMMLLVAFSDSIVSILTQNVKEAGNGALPDVIHPYKTYFIPLILPLVLSYIFYLGYRSNRRSYDLVFWKSYRRNEFIKWFEVKNGSLQNVFNINSNNLTQAIDFVTDILYFSSDQYLKNFASIILTKLESCYKRTKKILDNNSNSSVLNDVTSLMSYCYKEWRDGSHELVLEKSFTALKRLNVILRGLGEDEEKLGTEFWQEMRGYLLLAENFYMRYAYYDITNKLTEWDWINKTADSANVPTDRESREFHSKLVEIYYSITRNLSLSYDDWDRAITSLEGYFQNHFASTDVEAEAFDHLRKSGALRDFGGYHYIKSIEDLEALEKGLNTEEYSWFEIIIAYSKQWKLIEMSNHSIKIIPINITDNGKIDIWVENNPNRISKTTELYDENQTKLEHLPKLKEISSKEIIVIDNIASLITYSYQKGNLEMLGYQILFSRRDIKELFCIKYEEEKNKRSSVEMFENLIHSLRKDEW